MIPTTKHPSRSIRPAWAVLLIALVGCSALRPKGDATQFYVLAGQAAASRRDPTPIGGESTIVIGPSRMPYYLDSTPLVVSDGPNRVLRLDFHQWAEPLDKGINRVLADNLCRLLDVPRVAIHPETVPGKTGWEITYTVTRFDGGLAGEVVLDVYWRVQERGSGQVHVERRSQYAVPVGGGAADPTDYVARMSDALAQWSADIAAAVAGH